MLTCLDPVFGHNGMVRTNVGTTPTAYVYAIMAQPDGKLVCGGNIDGRFGVVRYTADGSLDPVFGEGGVGMTRFISSSTPQLFVIQPDGKLVAAGSAVVDDRNTFAVARFLPSATTEEGQ